MSMNGSLVQGEGKDGHPKNVAVVPPRTSVTKKSSCLHGHLNSLWSIWYGLSTCVLQAYIAVQSVYRFLDYINLVWPEPSSPKMELHAYVILTGTSVLLLPVFLASAIFKVGNLANDGFKLGRNLSVCSVDPPSAVSLGGSGFRGFWRHSGPTAPLIHIVSAFCLLLPRILIEAKLIQAGFLPKDSIWRTDLDFIISHNDRLVLSFMTSQNNFNNSFLPTPLPQDTSSSNQPQSMLLTVGVPGQEIATNDETQWGHSSTELFNYILALVVYSVRYPAVFWSTNKYFGILFSLQLLFNSLQNLVMYAGVCVLYKIHVIGPAEALSTLHSKIGLSFGIPQNFLLNRNVTLALFILSSVLVFNSSLVLYLYGYGRLNAFLNRERARRVISLQESSAGKGWSYFTHCAALCVLVAIAVCQAPILFDCTVVYRKSLNTAVLICVVGTVVHLFLWVLLWLVLTIKQHWLFKLRVTIGRAAVRSARSIKLVTDVDLLSYTDTTAPLLVVGNGRTYSVSETSPKKAIMGVIQKSAMEKKSRSNQASHSRGWVDRDEEQIYWLRPKPPSPKNSPDSSTSDRLEWLRKPSTSKHKVTFDPNSVKCSSGKDVESDDDGDYARLRELPLLNAAAIEQSDDTASEDNKATPRCLRRADSGMPPEELTPRSDSVSTEASGSPPDNSETSSGVHSNSNSTSSRESTQRRSTSVHDLATDAANKIQPQWRSSSLQRGMIPPQPDQSYNAFRASQPQHIMDQMYSNIQLSQDPTYLNCLPRVSINPHEQIYAPYRPQQLYTKSPPVIKETAEEDVVIRRKVERKEIPVNGSTSQEPFGRATNIRMTTFSDHPQQSATLPHYPTQTVSPAYPNCSTMPLPGVSMNPRLMGVGTSCNSFPRQHTTIPTHHNGIRLFNSNLNTKRLFPSHVRGYILPDSGHHSFPQIMNMKYNPIRKSERDSANFSLASSGDSDLHA
uniref:Protein tincar n=1 Tax=Clastoptera arizonana TaxID=38151 RepID=A0A1B6EGG5_9HEMI